MELTVLKEVRWIAPHVCLDGVVMDILHQMHYSAPTSVYNELIAFLAVFPDASRGPLQTQAQVADGRS